jgi:DNA-binding beta-propeller fold protein YncE
MSYSAEQYGKPVETFSGSPINGPWDMTVLDQGAQASLFVTNVLNGGVATANPPQVVNKGTVVRIEISVPKTGEGIPMIQSTQIIGSGFAEIADPVALIIGPTGVGLGKDGTLYVADSESNRIAAIPNALHRVTTAYAGKDVSANGKLNGPLGLAIAPNGDILTSTLATATWSKQLPRASRSQPRRSAPVLPVPAPERFLAWL